MDSIGDRLRQERLRRGFDLGQIAELTKISPAMLEAIEADDFEKLPGTFFARSFVRQYAQVLELDEAEFDAEVQRIAGYEEPVAPLEEMAARAEPVRAQSVGQRPGGHSLAALAAFVVIVAVCSGVYTLVQRAHQNAKPAVVSTRPAPTPEAPVETPAPAATPEAAAEAASPTPTPEAAPAPEAGTAPIRLELHSTAEAWVRVVGDGKTLYSGVLQPGEARVFQGQVSMTLRTGNAGALAVTYNGQPVGELGPLNQVRTVAFTPSGFTFVTAAAPTPQTQDDGP